MLINKHRLTITASSGGGSENTLKFSGADLVQVYAKAKTSTNIFDLSLVDEDNDTVLEYDAVEGEMEEHSIYMPMRGVYTVTISDATIDEAIVVKLMIEE